MPNVATNGSACTTGHGCDTTTTVNGGSSNVIIGNKGVARKDDPLASHTIPQGTNCIPHLAQKVNEGSATVFVNGEPIARVGDSVDVGGAITSGDSTVVAGG
tara:strand:- start:18 stop:323 length:306 start_codon:yes stop_codon:yes gene_type:complete